MPDLDKIKKFSSIVHSLGSEPAISRDRSEASEEIQMEGGEELPSDLSSLIDAAAESPGQPPEENIEEYGSIDDIALESDLRKDVTPDLLTIDDSEGGLSGFGEGTDQIDLGDAESQDFEIPDMETELPNLDAGLPDEDLQVKDTGSAQTDDFSLPEDFSFGDEAGSETGTPAGAVEEKAGEYDFSLPDIGADESAAPDATPGADEGIESFDLGDAGSGDLGDFSFDEETGGPGPEASSLDNLEFSVPEEMPADDIGKVSGFEGIGEGFDLPESAGESFEVPDSGGFEAETGDEFDTSGIEDFSAPGFDEGAPIETPMEAGTEFESEAEDKADEFATGLGTPAAAEGEEEFAIDQLGELELPDMGEAAAGFEEPLAEEPVAAAQPRGRRREESRPEGRNFTDREFTAIQATLASLPRNLKLKVQTAIGKSIAKGEQLNKLLSFLIRGANASDIASLVTQITGEQIVIPKQFEKRTGFAYEEEKRSFSHVLKTNIIPLLTIMIPLLLVLGLLVFLGIKASAWIEAQSHYNKGLEYISKQKRFAEGNNEFDLGYKLAPDNTWFYKYAEAFITENQYADAQDKYERLLGLVWKDERIDFMANIDSKGILDYSSMESKILANYPKADTLLAYLVFKDSANKEAILARGDNYLEWADNQAFRFEMASNRGEAGRPETLSETGKSIDELYEAGRLAYAEYRNRFGETNDVKFRFLHYFIMTDNLVEAEALKTTIQANPDIKVDPLVYAELGGYLIDKNELLDVRDILNRASKVNPFVPEIHYQFARYLGRMDQDEGVEGALNETIRLLAEAKPLSMKRILTLIDSHNRLGKLHYSKGRIRDAETELEKAILMIENPEQKSLFGINPIFGETYYNRANILYDAKDFEIALELYSKAKNELFTNPDMSYKIGYINDRNSDLDSAILSFYDSEQANPENLNTLYAIANTLFKKEDYFAAQGYYEHLIRVLDKTKAGITSIRPEENPVHLLILNLTMRAYNNLGITMKRLSDRPRNPRRESEALAYLTRSQEYYNLLARSLYGSNGTDKNDRDLAYLNQTYILYPVPGYDLYIYDDLPVDPETTYVDDLFSTRIK